MRVRLPLGRSVFFGCALVAALVVLLPLRLALGWLKLDEAGFSAREAVGSVWLGGVREARIGGLALGGLHARLSPLQLLIGRARIAFRRPDPTSPLAGAIGISRNSIGLDDTTGTLPAGSLFAPLPVAALDLTGVSVRFDGATCARAEGLVRATVSGTLAGVALPGGLSGSARCDAGKLLLPLASQSGQEALALRIGVDGGYDARLTLRPSDPAIAARLTATGFVAGADGYALVIQGRF